MVDGDWVSMQLLSAGPASPSFVAPGFLASGILLNRY
jgi:hypothetical protein